MKRRDLLAGSVAAFISPSLRAQTITAGAIALSGNRFRVDGNDFQLADILAPSQYAFGSEIASYTDEAKARLQRHIETQVTEFKDIAPPTRWDVRVVRSISQGNKPSIEELLIADGAARVAPQSDDIAFIQHLQAVEEGARQQKKGLWALEAYGVFDAENAEGAVDRYNLIEGVVAGARETRSRFYLNFGGDYRTDFTASAISRLYRKWRAGGFDLASLTGARVRIRGFVVNINGPSIDLTHQSQIEMLGEV